MQWNWPTPTRDGGLYKRMPSGTVLIPLDVDVNHGYGKTPVVNSEVTKKREALQRRLANLQRWAEGARKRTRK